eukprot:CAMPEP_0202453380 /NCGR_PEP_ID=MMETSP1360-20130828/11367_1 /ASSEMBLY_ACC=CAM_ASM_000848 /TAXON_ID=515479 /ORGANISM="Licmophora paradoxa, Strain CCMP2313" /LENGTH=710 /DNA_ID=CAMNT_0049072455 /DNA_START=49 /DNA_END=2184 /DNA_ORIENTATION=+
MSEVIDNGEKADEILSSDFVRPTIRGKTSLVNGVGLWNSWTRNFRSPFSAMMDLVDNSIDATLLDSFDGIIDCYRSSEHQNEVCMRNNCARQIADLDQVLEVFKSTKTESMVGENGVGVKQACAALSDLSFILSKNRSKLGIGVLNRDLQKPEGCCLPSYVLHAETMADDLDTLILQNDDLAQSIQKYGENGPRKILKHFEDLIAWPHPFTFLVVLATVDDPKSLLDELRLKVPKYYIHIPQSLRISVDGEYIKFQYWERRLADLTEIQTRIDKVNSVFTSTDWNWPDKGYDLRLFVGFDPMRTITKGGSQLSMYIYSRKSGRLVRKEEDARSTLKLSVSGTRYAQGMTIIVDDYQNQLQLTPTKQDIAFAQEPYGDVHRENLFTWIGAWCDVYYTYYEAHFASSGEAKGMLNREIQALHKRCMRLTHEHLKHSLMNGEFNELTNVGFAKYTRSNRYVRCSNRPIVHVEFGKHTLMKIIKKNKKLPSKPTKAPKAIKEEVTRPKKTASKSASKAVSKKRPATSAAPKSSESESKKKRNSSSVDGNGNVEQALQKKEDEIRERDFRITTLKKQIEILRSSNGGRKDSEDGFTKAQTTNTTLKKQLSVLISENKKLKWTVARTAPLQNEETDALKGKVETLENKVETLKKRLQKKQPEIVADGGNGSVGDNGSRQNNETLLAELKKKENIIQILREENENLLKSNSDLKKLL